MLLARKHKFLFVHIYKNAGSSITRALLPFAASSLERNVARGLTRLGIRFPNHWDPKPYTDHITASRLVTHLGRDTFDSLFSFAIVRNPWDWQVSLYTYMLKTTSHHQHDLTKGFREFDEYIRWRCDNEVRHQRDFVFSKDGEQLVDFIGRYENLEHDFDYICSRIGILARLPTINVSKTKPYQDYYNPKTIELVRQAFEKDIECFGYEFDQDAATATRCSHEI